MTNPLLSARTITPDHTGYLHFACPKLAEHRFITIAKQLVATAALLPSWHEEGPRPKQKERKRGKKVGLKRTYNLNRRIRANDG